MKNKLIILCLLDMFFMVCGAAPVGLVNEGNTCYQNATLQALYNFQGLRNNILNLPADYFLEKEADGDPTIAFAFKNLIQNIDNAQITGQPVVPQMFCATALTKQYNMKKGEQDDPYTFIMRVMNHITSLDINPQYKTQNYGYPGLDIASAEKGQFPIQSLFTQFFQLSYIVKEWTPISKRFRERFYIAQTAPPLINPQSSAAPDEIPHLNDLVSSSRYTFLSSPPYIIMPNIKPTRFGAKLLWPYFYINKSHEMQYDLIGIVLKIGQQEAYGHYTAYVKTEDNTWYYCDDRSITQKAPPLDSLAATGVTPDGNLPRLLFFRNITAAPPLIFSQAAFEKTLRDNNINAETIKIYLNIISKKLGRNVELFDVYRGIIRGVNTIDRLIQEINEFVPQKKDLNASLLELEIQLRVLAQNLK